MISCKDLCAGYGKRQILRQITWKGEPGAFTVIAGPNGCGKSTFLKSFMGQTTIMGGELYLEDAPMSSWSARRKARQLAYVPQNRSDVSLAVSRMVLHGRFPYVEYPRHYTSEDYDKVEWALEKMGIKDLGDRLLSDLSGGERQKAYLAMALAQDTSILLLDEPTTYLDISCQLELMELLKGLAAEGRAVIAVLHDLNHCLEYGDQMVLMDKGAMAAWGTPEQVLAGGRLEEVFGLKVHGRTWEDGKRYYWFERKV